jgi:NADPH-ferrihemoprotein reductase
MQYTVFGLGNKTYEQYNKMGKDTDKHLENKGAKRLYSLGLGDDDHSLEEDFEKWKRELWRPFCVAAGLDAIEPAKVQKQRKFVFFFFFFFFNIFF